MTHKICLILIHTCFVDVSTLAQMQPHFAQIQPCSLTYPCSEPGEPSATAHMQWRDKIKSWRSWAERFSSELELSDEDLAMARGPTPSYRVFDRVILRGVRLGSARAERGAKAINSIVMANPASAVMVTPAAEGETGAAIGVARGGPRREATGGEHAKQHVPHVWVGRVQYYLEHMPPGAKEGSPAKAIAAVQWFKNPEDVSGRQMDWNFEIQAPVVTKDTRNVEEGNFFAVADLMASKFMLAPHVDKPNVWWQVLHVDSDIAGLLPLGFDD